MESNAANHGNLKKMVKLHTHAAKIMKAVTNTPPTPPPTLFGSVLLSVIESNAK
jgi:hypothetical protein